MDELYQRDLRPRNNVHFPYLLKIVDVAKEQGGVYKWGMGDDRGWDIEVNGYGGDREYSMERVRDSGRSG